VKLYWKVAEPPTGRYRAFEHRGWPSAYYDRELRKPAAMLYSEDEYRPAQVRTGQHKPIHMHLMHYQHPNAGSSWKVMKIVATAPTLDEAKKRVQAFLEKHPEFYPKGKEHEETLDKGS
jgi:hypothetical protein